MSSRRLTIVASVAVLVAVLLIFVARNSFTASAATGQSPSIRFRNSLCQHSDCWCNVHFYSRDDDRPISARAVLKEQGLYTSYNATLESNGDVTVRVFVNNWNIGSTIVFPSPEIGGPPQVPSGMPDFLKSRATEFARKLVQAIGNEREPK
jgi:hypothetical protein